MTYQALLKRLQKLTPAQLKAKVELYEGCSGNYTTITCVEVASEDQYHEGEEPGTERHKELTEIGVKVKPHVKKGQVFICHDH